MSPAPLLLAELDDVLARPKFRKWVSQAKADDFVKGLREATYLVDDPSAQTGLTPDPDDDYLLTLAHATESDYIVSGDTHLLNLPNPKPPVLTPQQFLGHIEPA